MLWLTFQLEFEDCSTSENRLMLPIYVKNSISDPLLLI